MPVAFLLPVRQQQQPKCATLQRLSLWETELNLECLNSVQESELTLKCKNFSSNVRNFRQSLQATAFLLGLFTYPYM